MDHLFLFCLPLIGAGIGWFTNYLAVKMLFKPRRPIRILGLTIQGLVPKRQPELAERIGEIVEEEFALHQKIGEILNDRESMMAFRRLLIEKVDTFITKQTGTLAGLVGAFFSEDKWRQIKEAVVDSVMENVPESIEGASRRLEEKLKIKETVSHRIASFDLDKLEEIARHVAHRELNHIQVLGGVLGFLIGLVQMALIWAFF